MDPMLDFTGKVALITGAASGFGKLLAAELGKRGARLVLGDINMDALDKLAADLEGQGATALARRCDVSSEADCKAMVDTAVEQFGRLDRGVDRVVDHHPVKFCRFETVGPWYQGFLSIAGHGQGRLDSLSVPADGGEDVGIWVVATLRLPGPRLASDVDRVVARLGVDCDIIVD